MYNLLYQSDAVRGENSPQRSDAPKYYHYHRRSYPERQNIIDFMDFFGIEIAEAPDGTYYLRHLLSGGIDEVLQLSKHRAFVRGTRTCGVRMDESEYLHFYSHQEAYWALEYLYHTIRREFELEVN